MSIVSVEAVLQDHAAKMAHASAMVSQHRDVEWETPARLEMYALDPSYGLGEQLYAASNVKAKSSTLAHLARCSNAVIRWHVAANHKTPMGVLTELAADADPFVRARVAMNGKTARVVLARLVQDHDPRVRWCAERNAKTPAKKT